MYRHPGKTAATKTRKNTTWNRGLGLFTLQGSSPRIQQCLKEEEVCKTARTCHFALDVLQQEMEQELLEKTCVKHADGSPRSPSRLEQDDSRATSEMCQLTR